MRSDRSHERGFTPPSPGGAEVFGALRMPLSLRGLTREEGIAHLSEEVISTLESKARRFLDRASCSTLFLVDAARHKRYTFLERLVSERSHTGSARGLELLRWSAAGYIREFIRQTEREIPPLNIANPVRPIPEAARYWATQPDGALQREAEHGIRHSARTYEALRDELFRGKTPSEPKRGRKVALDATAEIIRASIDLFRDRGHDICGEKEPRASIYNDHVFVVEYAKRHLRHAKVA